MLNIILLFQLFNLIINSNLSTKALNDSNYNEFTRYKALNFLKNHDNKRNVILGVIQDYPIDIILPFFNSLIYSDIKNCDIIIFVRKVSTTLIKFLKDYGVLVYEIPEKYDNITIINIRWKMYIDFLKEKIDKYHIVFSADIRDTLFQKDIFKYYENYSSFLGVAIEDGTLEHELNKKWIIDFVGIEKYQLIQKERIICIGTIWGSLDKFLEFSIIFWKNLISNTNSIEQGICNYLFYYEKIFNDCLIKSDNYGPIMTIGLTENNNIKYDSKNNILNFGGEIAAVIHQYDRKPDIVTKVNNKFIFFNKININDFNKNILSNTNMHKKTYYENTISFLIFLQSFSIILIFKYIKFYFEWKIKKKNTYIIIGTKNY